MRGKSEQLTRAQPAWGGRAAKERLCPRSLQALSSFQSSNILEIP